jgi:ferredoxin
LSFTENFYLSLERKVFLTRINADFTLQAFLDVHKTLIFKEPAMDTQPTTGDHLSSSQVHDSDKALESATAGLPAPDGPRAFRVTLARQHRSVEVPAEVSLLDALEAAGVIIPSVCREGHCGTCECAVLEGAVEHHDQILGPDERASNKIMMVCVSRAQGEHLVLDV